MGSENDIKQGELIECAQCKKLVIKTRSWMRFCSVTCRMAYGQERVRRALSLLQDQKKE